MRTHLMKEGKKSQFLFLETGDISLTSKDIESLSRVLGKISPFADPGAGFEGEDEIWLSIITGLSMLDNFYVVSTLAENPSLPASFLERLFYQDPDLYLHLGKNPATPENILEMIFNNDVHHDAFMQDSIKLAVSANPSTPPRLLEAAFPFPQYVKRDFLSALASNPALSEEKLREIKNVALVQNTHEEVWPQLASNPSCPRDLLEELVSLYSFKRVQEEAARNPSTPENVLRELSKQKYGGITNERIMQNPSTPPDVLNDMVALDRVNWYLVASNPSISPEMFAHFYKDESMIIWSQLARNPKTKPSQFNTLFEKATSSSRSRNWDRAILRNIASNPNAPSALLERIYNLPDLGLGRIELDEKLAANPSTPVGILFEIYNGGFWENKFKALARNTRGFSKT